MARSAVKKTGARQTKLIKLKIWLKENSPKLTKIAKIGLEKNALEKHKICTMKIEFPW
jgi:hypothetical protein